jgi:ribosome-associated protein
MTGIQVSNSLEIPDGQLEWSFSRSSGPGGQNVNKVNTKATLRWIPPAEFLPAAAWKRFQRKARRYLTIEGEVVIQSQEHRDRAQNVEACRNKLRHLILAALITPKKRIATKPSRASKQRRLDEKRRKSDKKTGRRLSE